MFLISFETRLFVHLSILVKRGPRGFGNHFSSSLTMFGKENHISCLDQSLLQCVKTLQNLSKSPILFNDISVCMSQEMNRPKRDEEEDRQNTTLPLLWTCDYRQT